MCLCVGGWACERECNAFGNDSDIGLRSVERESKTSNGKMRTGRVTVGGTTGTDGDRWS